MEAAEIILSLGDSLTQVLPFNQQLVELDLIEIPYDYSPDTEKDILAFGEMTVKTRKVEDEDLKNSLKQGTMALIIILVIFFFAILAIVLRTCCISGDANKAKGRQNKNIKELDAAKEEETRLKEEYEQKKAEIALKR